MAIPVRKGKLVYAEKRNIRILSVSKSDGREFWTFEKSQVFIPSMLQFLLDLGFTLEKDIDIKYFFGLPYENEERYTPEEYIADPFAQKYLPIRALDQQLITMRKMHIDIEVIFFHNRIVLALRTNKSSSEIGELVSKFALFGSEKV